MSTTRQVGSRARGTEGDAAGRTWPQWRHLLPLGLRSQRQTFPPTVRGGRRGQGRGAQVQPPGCGPAGPAAHAHADRAVGCPPGLPPGGSWPRSLTLPRGRGAGRGRHSNGRRETHCHKGTHRDCVAPAKQKGRLGPGFCRPETTHGMWRATPKAPGRPACKSQDGGSRDGKRNQRPPREMTRRGLGAGAPRSRASEPGGRTARGSRRAAAVTGRRGSTGGGVGVGRGSRRLGQNEREEDETVLHGVLPAPQPRGLGGAGRRINFENEQETTTRLGKVHVDQSQGSLRDPGRCFSSRHAR